MIHSINKMADTCQAVLISVMVLLGSVGCHFPQFSVYTETLTGIRICEQQTLFPFSLFPFFPRCMFVSYASILAAQPGLYVSDQQYCTELLDSLNDDFIDGTCPNNAGQSVYSYTDADRCCSSEYTSVRPVSLTIAGTNDICYITQLPHFNLHQYIKIGTCTFGGFCPGRCVQDYILVSLLAYCPSVPATHTSSPLYPLQFQMFTIPYGCLCVNS